MHHRLKLTLAMLMTLPLSGCDFFEWDDTGRKPWSGYAFSTEFNSLVYIDEEYPTYERCIKQMVWDIESNPKYSLTHKAPIGCLYNSNGYWKSWFYNKFYGGPAKIYLCENVNPAAMDTKVRYQGSFDDLAARYQKPNEWHCNGL